MEYLFGPDREGEPQLDFDGFVAFIKKRTEGVLTDEAPPHLRLEVREDVLREEFDKLDANGNGVLDLEEIDKTLAASYRAAGDEP